MTTDLTALLADLDDTSQWPHHVTMLKRLALIVQAMQTAALEGDNDFAVQMALGQRDAALADVERLTAEVADLKSANDAVEDDRVRLAGDVRRLTAELNASEANRHTVGRALVKATEERDAFRREVDNVRTIVERETVEAVATACRQFGLTDGHAVATWLTSGAWKEQP